MTRLFSCLLAGAIWSAAAAGAGPLELGHIFAGPEESDRAGQAIAFTDRGAISTVRQDLRHYNSNSELYALDLNTGDMTHFDVKESVFDSNRNIRKVLVKDDRALLCGKRKHRDTKAIGSSMISLQTGQPIARYQPARQTGSDGQSEIRQYGMACDWHDNLVAIAVRWRNRETRDTTDEVLLFDAENGARVAALAPVPGVRTKGAVFGRAIAINDSVIAVSTTGADIKTGYFGRVDLYDRRTLAHLRTFTRPENGLPYNDGAFGSNVALHDDWIIITASFDSEVGREGDTVWIYDLSTGAPVYRFAAPGNVNASLLGRSFAIHDGMILLGEPWTRAGGKKDAGKAWLHDLQTGTLLQELSAPTPRAGAEFGSQVALGPQGALISAVEDRDQEWGTGALYHFRWKSD